MEYIQTVLLQVDASRLEEASQAGGLLADLDDHRDYLRQQPGFRDLRVTRSINNEGNVLVIIETRWSDDASLVRYETGENNVARIVSRHSHIVARDSVQVLDMEALRTESSFRAADAGTEARQRVTLPLLVPIGVLAFALLIIYGLSRVYLEIRGDGATALAAGISIGILAIAFYLANNPRVPTWQIGGIFVLMAAVLAGGTIWALSEEDDTAAEEPAASATPSAGSPTPGGGGSGGSTAITMTDNKFDPAEITVSAGADVTFDLTNDGVAIHNMRIAGEDGQYNTGDDASSEPGLISGGGTATLEWTAPDSAGEIIFQCDFHPTDMKGVITVE
ncbi:MAG TPA: cupredoxin domain-containing protein [Dehalococcoidia bacterium]|nr:cupredoxin domain-containing protein [Dehalococcoidia bacterium]